MADEPDKAAQSAEKAYASASESVPAKTAPVQPALNAPAPKSPSKPPIVKAQPKPKVAPKAKVVAKPKPVAAPAASQPVKPKAAPAVTLPKRVAKPAPVKTVPVKAAPAAKPALKPAVAPKITPLSKPFIQLKDTLMVKTPEFTKTVSDVMSEFQTRAKEAYEKSTEMAGEASEFAKGNVEAIVESGKILSSGMQDMGKTCIDEAKSAFETLTADMKEMAAVKSPTELFQLQGKLMRRNFDSLVAFGSKNSEAMVKLANETMAPLSSRMSVAADKVSKAAA